MQFLIPHLIAYRKVMLHPVLVASTTSANISDG